MNPPEDYQSTIRNALEPFESIAFALFFGSAVSGRLRSDSDLDVAVYGSSGRHLEIERDRELAGEAQMQLAVERATGRNVDLLVLNRAPAVVCASVVRTGVPLFVRDESVYSRYILAVTDTAIDFLETEREWREIRARSASLSAGDRTRLERILAFLDDELTDAPGFADTTLAAYQHDRSPRLTHRFWIFCRPFPGSPTFRRRFVIWPRCETSLLTNILTSGLPESDVSSIPISGLSVPLLLLRDRGWIHRSRTTGLRTASSRAPRGIPPSKGPSCRKTPASTSPATGYSSGLR